MIAGLTASLAALVLGGCTVGPAPGTSGPKLPYLPGVVAAAARLISFDSCDQALSELQAAAEPHVSPYGLQPGWEVTGAFTMGTAIAGPEPAGPAPDTAGDAPVEAEAAPVPEPAPAPGAAAERLAAERPAAPEPAADAVAGHSTTNVHEAGVDEPDLVKTDGRRLVSLQQQRLRVVDLQRREVTGTLELPGAAEQLLLAGDRLLVVAHAPGNLPLLPEAPATGRALPAPEGFELVLVDISGPPRVIERIALDGSYTDARLVGSTARVVLRSSPRLPTGYPVGDRSAEEAQRANLAAVRDSTIDDWLPRYVHEAHGRRQSGRLVDCADVSHPEHYSGTAMLTVLTVDVTTGLEPLGTVSVLGDGHTVYATGDSLYVADRGQWWASDTDPGTHIHKFDLSGTGKPAYVASGEVDGYLLNQYSMSEHAGHLRIATTTQDLSRPPATTVEPESESQVVVLAERDGRLAEIGRVGGLGRGERIYAVRFLGPIGYVVTFREVDPLYTVDLSDPANPRLLGELKIPGYSAYLHPAGEGRLVGVGQDAAADGRPLGAQVSLFDVADLTDPRRIATFRLDGATTEVEYDPHAFLYWSDDGLLVLPFRTTFRAEPLPLPRPGAAADLAAPWQPPAGGAVVLRLAGDTFTELGTIVHPTPEPDPAEPSPYGDPNIRRSVVSGDTLWTVSAAGVMGHGTRALDGRAWIPFD
jgi:hypothetical protein